MLTLFLALPIKAAQQFISVLEIPVHKDSCELISTNAEYRTVFIYIADNLGCFFQIDIAFVVSVLIVYFLQIITVKDRNSKKPDKCAYTAARIKRFAEIAVDKNVLF